MITNVIGWMLFGLIAGAIARFLHPGYDRMGMAGTMILGILGSLVGGGIAYMLRLGRQPVPAGGLDHVDPRRDPLALDGLPRHARPDDVLTDRIVGSTPSAAKPVDERPP